MFLSEYPLGTPIEDVLGALEKMEIPCIATEPGDYECQYSTYFRNVEQAGLVSYEVRRTELTYPMRLSAVGGRLESFQVLDQIVVVTD